jgi:hypothetical protein
MLWPHSGQSQTFGMILSPQLLKSQIGALRQLAPNRLCRLAPNSLRRCWTCTPRPIPYLCESGQRPTLRELQRSSSSAARWGRSRLPADLRLEQAAAQLHVNAVLADDRNFRGTFCHLPRDALSCRSGRYARHASARGDRKMTHQVC